MNFRLLILFLLMWVFISVCRDAEAEEYKFLTKNFISSAEKIKPETFFSSEVPIPPASKNLPDELKEKSMPSFANKYYDDIASQIGQPPF